MENIKKELPEGAATPEESDGKMEEMGRWLEIDGETIVGVHSHRCQSELIWVKYEGDDEVSAGWLWKDNKVVQPEMVVTKEHLKLAAGRKITETYPIWKQLNILRDGDSKKIEKMAHFIDSVREWSDSADASMSDLDAIQP